VRILFSVTALLGAFLLFLVEPMFARMVLPLLGGAPAVWNSCLVFYQVALLVGYLYAHAVSRRPARQQAVFQIALLAAAAVALPIAVHGGGAPPASANPIGWVFRILVVSLGLPFVVLATTGPLLQRWFASLGPRTDGSPYSLFAASNIGSFVALLGYPFLVEPLLRLRQQSVTWTAGYALYALLMLLCGAALWRANPDLSASPPPVPTPAPARGRRARATSADVQDEDDPWAKRLHWLGLAAVPSSLMMSVTTFISTDVGSIPLLWVVPLALYLLTFVLAFAERQLIPRRVVTWLFPIAVVLVVALVIAPPVYPLTMIGLHLSAFFVVSLACHLELAASRPPAEQLTEFYLWLSAGGAVGGLFNALIAPLIFVNPFEYPLAALSACLLLPEALGTTTSPRSQLRTVGTLAMTAVPVTLVALLVMFVQRFDARIPADTFTRYAIIFGPPCLAAFVMRRTPLRMGIALAAVVVSAVFVRFDSRMPIHLERSFFGVHRVLFSGRERVLLSGTTNHGAQSIDPALACEPLTYYSRGGPVGQLFAHLAATAPVSRVGVVGLGTASMAAYASPGQTWTFFEINPVVERIARDPDYFTYLRDCAPTARVVTGDARLMLALQPDAAFDVLVLDAFSSDSIPVHLMTREAMQLYVRTLAPHGVIAVHVSNRYLELAPVVGATAREAGLVSMTELHGPTEEQHRISAEISPSRWVLLARSRADFGALTADSRWESLDEVDGPVWTDDYSNVIGVLRH
jgi:hypothetical protein